MKYRWCQSLAACSLLLLAGSALASGENPWQYYLNPQTTSPLWLQCLLYGKVDTPLGTTSVQLRLDGHNSNLGSAELKLKLSIPLDKFKH